MSEQQTRNQALIAEHYKNFKVEAKNLSKNELIRALFNALLEAKNYKAGYEHYHQIATLAAEADAQQTGNSIEASISIAPETIISNSTANE